MKRTALLTTMVAAVTVGCAAQWDSLDYAPIGRDSARIVYGGGTDLREGLYFGFEDFRANRPSVAPKGLRDAKGQPAGDLRQSDWKLYWTDSSGTARRIDMDRIWGFCDRNTVYVRIGNGFNRIGIMGAIAHVVYDNTYRTWGSYGSMYGMGPVTTTVQEQRLLDMGTGQYLPVNAGGIYQAILPDEVLRAEFEALPKKERNADETVFRFMRLYNERHPLSFPR